jgi:hypothetical protein
MARTTSILNPMNDSTSLRFSYSLLRSGNRIAASPTEEIEIRLLNLVRRDVRL